MPSQEEITIMAQGYAERTYNATEDLSALVEILEKLYSEHGMMRQPIMDVITYIVRQLEVEATRNN